MFTSLKPLNISALNQLSFNTAQQHQAGVEPAFLSPTKSFAQTGPKQLFSPNVVYAPETPERDNAGFYTSTKPSSLVEHPTIPGGPVIHQAPQRNHQIRDRVTMSTGDHSDL